MKRQLTFLLVLLPLLLSGCDTPFSWSAAARMIAGGAELAVPSAVENENFPLCMGEEVTITSIHNFAEAYPLIEAEAADPDGTLTIPGWTFDARGTCQTIKPEGWPPVEPNPALGAAIYNIYSGSMTLAISIGQEKDENECRKQIATLVLETFRDSTGKKIVEEILVDADFYMESEEVTIEYDACQERAPTVLQVKEGDEAIRLNPSLSEVFPAPQGDDDDSAEGGQ